MKDTSKPLSFRSKLERIATDMEYYALSVPAKVTLSLGTKQAIPVAAKVNGSEIFIASFYPVGGGRHYLRVRNKICKSVNIKAGDPVRVQFTVRDRLAEIALPKDLKAALKAKNAEKDFKALPIGKKSYLIRLIEKAVKPETREKKVAEAVRDAQQHYKKLERK